MRQRPILAKEGSQAVRYEIQDNFFAILVQLLRPPPCTNRDQELCGLQAIINVDYPLYSGRMLERYFKQQFAESGQYRTIGSWWKPKGDQNVIEIVALKLEKNQAVAVEVKRQKKNFKPALLDRKVEHLKHKLLSRCDIETRCLSLEDM